MYLQPRDKHSLHGAFAMLCCAVRHALTFRLCTCRSNGPSKLVDMEEDSIWEFDSACCSIPAALRQLAEALGADETPYYKLPRKLSANGGVPSQSDPLTPRALCAAIVSLQPEGAIVVDESLTSGSSYWELSQALLLILLQLFLGRSSHRDTCMPQDCSGVQKRCGMSLRPMPKGLRAGSAFIHPVDPDRRRHRLRPSACSWSRLGATSERHDQHPGG